MRSKRRALASVIISTAAVLSVAAATPAAGPRAPLSDYTITSWSRRDGISGPILSISQDKDGYLWLGTGSGPIRFDGHRFVSWESLGYEPFPGHNVLSLLSSKDGSLWIGSADTGVARLRNGAFTFYRDPEGLAFARTLLEDRRGNVWAGSRGGLYRFDGTRWVLHGASVGLPASPISGIHEDADGALWVQTLQRIYRRGASHDSVEHVTDVPPFVRPPLLAPSAARRGRHTLPRAWNPFRTIQDRRGDLWLATIGQGVWRARFAPGGATVEHVTTETGLSSNVVGAVYEDRESNLWIATQAGLHKLTLRKVTPIDNLGTVTVVEATNDGSTWFGSDKGLIRITKDRRHTYTERDGMPPGPVRAIVTDRRNRLWIATDVGLACFSDGRFVRLPLPERFDRVLSVSVDSREAVWLNDMRLGVLRLQNGALAQLGTIARLDGTQPASVHVDRSDRVWLGFGDGHLGLLGTDGRISRHPTGIKGAIVAISEEPQGVLWLGGEDGIARFSDGRSVAITAGANGFPGSQVIAVIDDGRGAVWAGTSAGIVRVERSEFDVVARSPAHRIRYVLYDETDGLHGMPARLAAPAAARGVDGRLWFVTDGGATMVDPASLPRAQQPPRVRVEEVRAAGTRFDPTAPFRIGPRPERVEIDYTALTFSSPAAVRFSYRLIGFDSNWQDAGSRRQASYTNLPPGDYKFQVVARNKDGSFDPSGASVTFAIAPAFYQTWWFLIVVAAAVVGLGAAAWRMRVQQIRERFSLALAERARISREVHDTLLQSLVGVALRSGTAAERLLSDPAGAREQLNGMRKEVEEQIRELRETIWNLRSPTLHRRGLAGALEEAGKRIAHQTSARFTFGVVGRPQPCAPVVEEQLLRIGQEALLNAAQHSHASEVRAELQYDGDAVALRVVDNGVGFDVDAAMQRHDHHFGLFHMHERAAQAGGRLEVISRNGAGTQVLASFPRSFRGAA